MKWGNLHSSLTEGAHIEEFPAEIWRLSIPPGRANGYRCAQLDDCYGLLRRAFLWRPPVDMQFSLRASHASIPGTWGAGLWNDPFPSIAGMGGMLRKLPALPNCSWFFYASPQNHLTLRDNQPANGMLSGVFRSTAIPSILLSPGLAGLPFVYIKFIARQMRKIARWLVADHQVQITADFTQWHIYRIHWLDQEVVFYFDQTEIFRTVVIPHTPLGFVVWVDNQYFGFKPDGSLSHGFLACDEPVWIEIK